MENSLAKLVAVILKPFLIKMMPSLFEDFDKHECNFAIVTLCNGDMKLGTMVPFVIKHHQKWDLFADIDKAPKIFGKALDKDEALELIETIRFERKAKTTDVIANLKIDELSEITVTYDNRDIWKLMKPIQPNQSKLP